MVFFPGLGRVYLFGGIKKTESSNIPSSTIYKWDLTSQSSWFEPISASIPSTEFWSNISNAVTINNTAYFIGVYDGSYTNGNIYAFDAITETFMDTKNLSPPPYPSTFGCLSANTTHISMIGGMIGSNKYSNYLQIYDVINNKWFAQNITIRASHSNGFAFQFCPNALINAAIFVFGGYGNNNCCDENYQYQWFDTENGNDGWTYLDNLPSNYVSYAGSCVYDEYNSRIYLVAGKHDENTYKNDILSYKSINGKEADVFHELDSVSSTSSIIIGAKLYIFGGIGINNNVTKSVQVCDINI